MLVLFTALLVCSVLFASIFLIKLPEDIPKRSYRPIFLLAFSIVFWVATLPAFIAPEIPTTTTYPAYNVIDGNQLIQYPTYAYTQSGQITVRDYNSFFYIWVGILGLQMLFLLLWFLNLLEHNARLAAHESADAMQSMERENR